jgi:nitrite reductase/ring-hydroxylating ferredoxin subunit
VSTDSAWQFLICKNHLEVGKTTCVKNSGLEIAVHHLDSGELFATDNICTHEFAKLSEGWLLGDVLVCPFHGGQFNVRSGKGICRPIEKDLKTYEIQLIDNDIFIRIKKN